MQKFNNKYIWRADIKKFFDSVNHEVLFKNINLKIRDKRALKIIKEIINSYSVDKETGIPIGNLTSQIFSNIYFRILKN